ncbi:type VII secretion protein EccB [Mycolicibacterium hippocampi]|uniref:Type VII secretion protein EccB n=2 Tax=Mycolicibacterium hippocampi TaxID=659824 RepID=A0A7I9ZLL7_9MYCO|nr:type VII secretion protein EccB [Mycolicibacterium hippocampi]
MHRMEHALLRGDARMLDDPPRGQSISLVAGAVLAAVAVAVCAVLALVRPAGELGDAPIVVVRETGAMYVQVDGTVHPVPNLASARLIARTPADPRLVGQAAVDTARRGPSIGIPGAPETISAPLTAEESSWTVCDDPRGVTTVIAGPIPEDAVSAGPGVLVTPRGAGAATTYLLYEGRRARVDLRHHAVVRALRLDGMVPRPISATVLAAIPEAPQIVPPHLPAAGEPGPRTLRDHSVGTVVRVPRIAGVPDSGADLFVVLADGVQRIGEVAADLLRYTDHRVGEQIPTVSPADVGTVPVVDTLPVTTYPERGGVVQAPVVCAHWQVGPDGNASETAVRTGHAVPAAGSPVSLAQADVDGPAVDAVFLPPGRSVFVHSVGLNGSGGSTGSLFLVTDSGVLYGVRDGAAAASLGLTDPAQPAPWAVLAALPRGPELSQTGASVLRDGIREGSVASP